MLRRLLLGLGVVVGLFVLWLFAVWPPPSWYRTHWPRRTAFMASRDTPDSLLRYRPVPLDSMTPVLAQAVLIGEDGNFYQHSGIDYLGLAIALGYKRRTLDFGNPDDRAAFVAVLPRAWSRRDRLRGASTVTQQLAKNLYLSSSRNPLRKVKEAVIAWRLEWALDKRRIMELYLNVVELGDGTWGVEAASQRYFQRSARKLSRDQAAALVATLPFPRSSNPGYKPGRMRWRQNLILRRMRGEWVEVPQAEPEADAAPPPVPVAPDEEAPAETPVDGEAPEPAPEVPAPESAPVFPGDST